MNTFIQDRNIVGETEVQLVEFVHAASTGNLLTISNEGSNTLNYRVQQFDGATWTDIGISGTDFYNTLTPSQIKTFLVSSAYPRTRIVGNASGGAILEFTSTRRFARSSGGPAPLLML